MGFITKKVEKYCVKYLLFGKIEILSIFKYPSVENCAKKGEKCLK